MRKQSLTIVVTLERWYWPCPHALKGPMKMLFFKAFQSSSSKKFDFWVRNSILKNVFKIILSSQIWLLVTFWMSETHRGHILNILSMLEAILRKTKFSCFLKFCFIFKQFWLQNGANLRTKFLKIPIFQKWSLKSKIRNG